MDRVPDFESVGCGFESRLGHLNMGLFSKKAHICTKKGPQFRRPFFSTATVLQIATYILSIFDEFLATTISTFVYNKYGYHSHTMLQIPSN
jgi:hypothetical protein